MDQMEDSQSNLNIYKLLRMTKGLTINSIAEKLGVTRAYISSIENGKRTPSDEMKQKYSELFHVSTLLLDTFEFPQDKSAPNFVEKSLLKILSLMITQ